MICFPSAINPVTTISVDYSCTSGMVTVTWDLVFGANMYRATAVDGTGASLNCTSASTSCQITMLQCGENYRVHVTAISDDCESISNISSTFETGELLMWKRHTWLVSVTTVSTCPCSSHVCICFPHACTHLLILPLKCNTRSSLSQNFPISLSCGKLLRILPWCPIVCFHAERCNTPSY